MFSIYIKFIDNLHDKLAKESKSPEPSNISQTNKIVFQIALAVWLIIFHVDIVAQDAKIGFSVIIFLSIIFMYIFSKTLALVITFLVYFSTVYSTYVILEGLEVFWIKAVILVFVATAFAMVNLAHIVHLYAKK